MNEDEDLGGRPHHYDREGRPCSLMFWASKFSDMNYRRIASTEIGGIWVSTVWIGLDHSFTGQGPPIIYETMCFPSKKAPAEPKNQELIQDFFDRQRRYSTIKDAIRGHDQLVGEIKTTLGIQDE